MENARRKKRHRHGGSHHRVDLDEVCLVAEESASDLEALDEALNRFEALDPLAARLVKLRFFAGLSMPQAAEALGIPLRTAERNWTYARTWLHRALPRWLLFAGLPIDQVFAKGDIRVHSIRNLEPAGSDHLPILVEFSFGSTRQPDQATETALASAER